MEQQAAVGNASAVMTAQSAFRAPHLRALPPLAFALLLLGIIFLLRIFYAGYVWADEGLWFTAAQELLRGKALYSEIWFDKPPAVAWLYAALFALAGPSLLAVRLFTIFYATLVALALWHMGRRFWGDEEGRLAALLYALYNATYLHSQVQPLAVDHLLLLPYLYAGFFFLYGRSFWSGLLVAVAFWLNPKALVLCLFFVAVELLLPKFRTLAGDQAGPLRRWGLLLAGFLAGCAPWVAYLLVDGKWADYLREFWGWGWSYVTVYSPVTGVLTGLRKTLNYAGFHFALFLGLALLLAYFPRGKATPEREVSHAVWLWLGASFLGVAIGGRFFPRYFYQVLPFLCLLAARGYRLARQAGEWLPEKRAFGSTPPCACCFGRASSSPWSGSTIGPQCAPMSLSPAALRPTWPPGMIQQLTKTAAGSLVACYGKRSEGEPQKDRRRGRRPTWGTGPRCLSGGIGRKSTSTAAARLPQNFSVRSR